MSIETWKDKMKKINSFGKNYNKNTLRTVECPECSNVGAEFIKEDIQAQGTIVTFKCSKCEFKFKVEY